ncbi:hypothetical protein Pst134EA_031514 [Puccinia striiformis f. sp. tritici]|uniref:Uncharacterized protein n=2 Tax=Puccinia striiformis TaxID=27350 RepID=A0A0L0W4H7_9BASI|nr:uncharacterized protein Pst134EA_031514 [Puccinia striiformis f. sp. tritici]KNE88951.1 hypothetical protein PSTG_17597 [Puccinia striiformis f. sp. tritici PST-78]POV96394.1 hypothetical protein PSTT_15668 [Puccinia striiformis]KAH9445260.1 hypothetical protein Pst134EA_031514 [Puccinia striiformis f. sp. tritici]KNF06356.1 hypothetical protein PSTG_00241 [Puccinia striiformis f. sp. tritici PST-78]KNF06357.1 hypothetical protein, variant [Puccinia striiformis f. sp. tritici PST-78]
MQDLIFLDSADFFMKNCDVLVFTGIFAAEAGPHLRARPNASPLAIYRLRAERQGQVTNEFASVSLNLSVPYHGGFAVVAGRSYQFRGTIGKLDDERTTVLQVDHDGDMQQVAETEIVELGPMSITGLGRIEQASLLFSVPLGLPVWKLILVHEGMNHSNADVKATYLIGVDSLDVPANTKFVIGSRIFLSGELDSLGSQSGMMIINVTGGMYHECF